MKSERSKSFPGMGDGCFMDLMPFWWSGELESVVMSTSYWCSPGEKQLQERKKEREKVRLRDGMESNWDGKCVM